MTSPCFRCVLPDCDDTDAGCLRRLAYASAQRKQRAGWKLTAEELFTLREFKREWVAAKRARQDGP